MVQTVTYSSKGHDMDKSMWLYRKLVWGTSLETLPFFVAHRRWAVHDFGQVSVQIDDQDYVQNLSWQSPPL